MCLVTTNYNYGDYLDECMRSVIGSRGFDRVDYVVMDGGSKDYSVDIIQKYEPQLKHWVSEKDAGMYHAIEKGFTFSDAPYMGWLNSDDQLAPWAIQSVLDIFDQLPEVKWITSRFPMQARQDGVVVATSVLPGADNWGFFNGEHVRSLELPSSGWIVQDCTFWRRELWEEVGGAFDHSLKLAADFELWARFMMRTDLYVVPVPFGIYRVQGNNKAMVNRLAYRDECVKVLQRYTPIIPQDLERLSQRVTSKKLAVAGLRHLIQENQRTPMKVILYNDDEQRYVAFEQT
ncbi:MAG TPA: glycosyltransferase [Rhodospirillaceae bacterium]|nr:glycosyl transferase [Candidatus Neomarinimicrobiota bacterium]HCX14682.1 glycosyltransferase [Rhodospirillaceae bacterium]